MAAFYWTLLLVANLSGTFSTDFKTIQIPMMTKEACLSAANELIKESKGVTISCIGSEKGEIIRIKNEK